VARTALLTLDLGTTAGWAVGTPPARPICGAIRLHGQARAPRYAALLEWLDDACEVHGVGSVVFEAPLVSGDFKGADAARLALGLAAHLELWAWDRSLPLREVAVGTARKAVLGRGTFAKGTAKGIVMDWAAREGFEPPTNDAADALVLWAYETGWHRQPSLIGSVPTARQVMP
jgi:Holliday junction resolvasome RuvABC endonuclease subunit